MISQKPKLTLPLKETLKKILTPKELEKAITSYDTLGDIAIIKIPDELLKKEKKIAQALMASNSKIKTVVKTDSIHAGKYRTQKVKYLAGKKTFLTFVKESGCVFKIRVSDSFFSSRLSFERTRNAQNVKPGEDVCVFFSGVAPFSIVIAKNSKAKKVVSVELNPKAHKYALENIKLNKVEDRVIAIKDDVKKYALKTKDKFDRIIMPLPKDAHLFFDSALKVAKKDCIITLYNFVPKDNPYTELEKTIKGIAKQEGRKIKIEFKRQVRDFSPAVIQVVLDIKVLN
ncbi:MAG: class I SAM-dependent methyltransferase family protein [Candidatus ainarchaeum sp.]|nr:class I SAM-dependent methyltransferase family protein [Candidatus ainarchaeum sp.]